MFTLNTTSKSSAIPSIITETIAPRVASVKWVHLEYIVIAVTVLVVIVGLVLVYCLLCVNSENRQPHKSTKRISQIASKSNSVLKSKLEDGQKSPFLVSVAGSKTQLKSSVAVAENCKAKSSLSVIKSSADHFLTTSFKVTSQTSLNILGKPTSNG